MEALAPSDDLGTPAQRTGTSLVVRVGVLILPAAILAIGAVVVPGPIPSLSWLGVLLVAALGLVLLPQPRLTQPSTGVAVIMEYVIAQVWLWFTGSPAASHWFPHMASGVLLIIPLLLFAGMGLERSRARRYDGPAGASAGSFASARGRPISACVRRCRT